MRSKGVARIQDWTTGGQRPPTKDAVPGALALQAVEYRTLNDPRNLLVASAESDVGNRI